MKTHKEKVEFLLEMGNDCLKVGDYKLAGDVSFLLQNMYVQNPEVYRMQAEALVLRYLFERNNPLDGHDKILPEATKAIGIALVKCGTEPQPNVLATAAKVNFICGNREEACKYAKATLQRDKGNIVANYYMGRLCEQDAFSMINVTGDDENAFVKSYREEAVKHFRVVTRNFTTPEGPTEEMMYGTAVSRILQFNNDYGM